MLLGYTRLDAKYDQDVDRGNVNAPFAGMPLPNAPEDQFSVWTRYTFMDGPLRGFFVAGGYRYLASRELSTNPQFVLRGFRVPSYGIVDAVIGYRTDRWLGRQTRLQLNVPNLTDERYIKHGRVPGDPRQFRVTVGVEF